MSLEQLDFRVWWGMYCVLLIWLLCTCLICLLPPSGESPHLHHSTSWLMFWLPECHKMVYVCMCVCLRVHVCKWVQGWTSHSKHIKAFPFALCLLNSKLEPTQSVLSLVSLCLLLLFNTATTHPLKNFPWQMEREASTSTAAASASDLLAHVEPGFGRGGGVFPHLAGEALGTITALEDFQTVRAFLPLLGAHLSLPKHRLADFGPEMAGTAVALRAVWWTQAGVAFMSCQRKKRDRDQWWTIHL